MKERENDREELMAQTILNQKNIGLVIITPIFSILGF